MTDEPIIPLVTCCNCGHKAGISRVFSTDWGDNFIMGFSGLKCPKCFAWLQMQEINTTDKVIITRKIE